MNLVKALVFRRQVLQWLIPLISLWVAIICGLAISSVAVADPDLNTDLLPTPGSQVSPSAIQMLDRRPSSNLASDSRPDRPYQSPAPIEPVMTALERPLLDAKPDLVPVELLHARRTLAQQPSLFVDGECPTPMSLMLHSSFGAERMRHLAREILTQGLKTTTYQEVTDGLRRGECPASNAIIVSLDDFGTDWLRTYFRPMIQAFTARGLSLVIAVNVHGTQDPDAWYYLRELAANGNEVANHTIDHYNLARLDPDQVRKQIMGAHQVICVNLGSCPETLILPFGIIDADGIVMEAAADYSYVVGIPGGRAFGAEPPYYLGRIGPDNFNQLRTLNELSVTFGQQSSAIDELMSLRAVAGRGCVASPSPSTAIPLARCISAVLQSPNKATGGEALPAY